MSRENAREVKLHKHREEKVLLEVCWPLHGNTHIFFTIFFQVHFFNYLFHYFFPGALFSLFFSLFFPGTLFKLFVSLFFLVKKKCEKIPGKIVKQIVKKVYLEKNSKQIVKNVPEKVKQIVKKVSVPEKN